MQQPNIMETKLARIAEISKERPKEVFTSIYHFLNKDLLMLCHKELDGKKATGLDGVTKAEYEENLEENIEQLEKELQNMSYKPSPAKRVYIPKANGKMRPLGIPSIWDRLIQQCVLQVLEPICEAKFHERSNGFRPYRSAQNAIAQCYKMIQLQHLYYFH